MRISRFAAPVVSCMLAALAVPATAGPAAARTAATRGPVEHVLLTLTPSDRGELRALARSSSSRRGTDAVALQRALPSVARRRSVADAARSLGLTVDRTSRMAVLVSGPASLVASLFGSARSVAPHSPVQHPLPLLPSVLRGQVTIALGGDDHRPAFRRLTRTDGTADGTDLRTSNGDTVTDPLHGGTPTAAEKAETIATVQLSGWHPSDLTAYAASLRSETGQAWPAPQYSAVDDPLLPSCLRTHANASSCVNSLGDDEEVDLDQEAIYAAAPYAKQRAYLSGNDLFGMYDSLAAIGDDASNPNVDRHIVAASVSWGFCESDVAKDPSSNSLYATFEDVLSYDLATGVTMFAATGDNGSACDGSHKGVIYPASSPQVVSVGGTEATNPAAPATQTGWNDSFGSSGGGPSSVFPAPSFQQAASTGSTMRTVPDISALAGNPGFDIWTSSPLEPAPGQVTVGGTSLATPAVTATYAAEVAQHNYTWGVGDILPGLYAQQATGFTDINDNCAAANATCSGWNGVDVAHTGYDQVTGLGSPIWSALISPALGGDPHLSISKAYSSSLTVPVTVRVPDWQSYNRYRVDVDGDHVCTVSNASATKPTSAHVDDFGFPGSADGFHDLTLVAFNTADNVCHYADAFVFIDTQKPTPAAKLAIGKGSRDVVASWSGNDSGGLGSGIASYRVTLGYPGRTVVSTTSTHPGTVSVAAKAGQTYTLSVTAVDRAGNSRTTTATLVDDRNFSYAGSWSRVRGSAAFDGSQAATVQRGARASVTTTGSGYTLYVTTCAACGKLLVSVGGANKTIDTYSRTTHNRVAFTVFSSSRPASRTVVVKALGTQRSGAGGHRVFIDGLTTKS